MSRYGRTTYGTDFYGEIVSVEFDASPFKVTVSGYDSTRVTWTRPAGAWDRQRLVRGASGYPLNETDGDVVIDQSVSAARSAFNDSGLTPGRYYYYALFVHDNVFNIWRRVGRSTGLVPLDWGNTARLYHGLPEVFRATGYNELGESVDDETSTFLYRWLSIFGFQFDVVRSSAETLLGLFDAAGVTAQLLPLLSAEVGMPYEPELGDRTMRGLVSNAVRLWNEKGTLQGVIDLATLVTGYQAQARIGTNLLLDSLDAGPDGGVGRWRGVGSTVGYQEKAVTDPVSIGGRGQLSITRVAGASALVSTGTTTLEGHRRLGSAVPVLANEPYTFSFYARRASGAARPISASMRFLDINGTEIVGSLTPTPVSIGSTWTRASFTATVPALARFVEPVLVATGLLSGETLLVTGLALHEGRVALNWESARQVHLYLTAPLTNRVGNPSGVIDESGWTNGVLAGAGTDGVSYLSFTGASPLFGTGTYGVGPYGLTPGQVQLLGGHVGLGLLGLTTDAPFDADVFDDTDIFDAGVTVSTIAPFDSAVFDPVVFDADAVPLEVVPEYGSGPFGITIFGTQEIPPTPISSPVLTYSAYGAATLANETWSALCDVSTSSAGRHVSIGFELYTADGVLVERVMSDPVPAPVYPDFRSISAQLDVGPKPVSTVALLCLQFVDVVAGEISYFRRAALINAPLSSARYFDGDSISSTQDYVWTGPRQHSPSDYYPRRSVAAARLHELIADYVAVPTSISLAFSRSTIPDTPASILGLPRDPVVTYPFNTGPYGKGVYPS